MNRSIIISLTISFLLLTNDSNGQADFINKTDNRGLRQGWWIIKAKDKPDWARNYNPDDKYEEGKYVDGKKQGTWTTYHKNGNIKLLGTYRNDTMNGSVKDYFENGCINEDGTWKNNRWIGEYKLHRYSKDTCGLLQQLFIFDATGKRISRKYYATGNEPKQEIDTILSWPHCTLQDSLRLQHCSCDSVILPGETKLKLRSEEPPKVEWTGKGYYRLYHKDKQLSKCGYFYKTRLIFGFNYSYDDNGKPIKITKYYNGFAVGDCKVNDK